MTEWIESTMMLKEPTARKTVTARVRKKRSGHLRSFRVAKSNCAIFNIYHTL